MNFELEEISDWKKLRKKLNNNYDFNSNWELAINLFKQRIDRKYFNPIECLISLGINEGEGFTILTSQCALIESLASLRQGKIFNHAKNSQSPKYEYSRSARMFVSFLNTDNIFKDHFWTIKSGKKQRNKPFNANNFYSDVRCGLLHEARTKGKWIISTNPRDPKTETNFLEKADGNIKILRSILHYRLKDSVNQYCEDLKVENSSGVKLRRFFGRKLDHQFEVNDTANEWWQSKAQWIERTT